MWKLAATGGVLLIAGAIRFAAFLNRVPTLEDYLAFRCGPSEAAQMSGSAGPLLLNWAHCWGCYAMVAGAGILALSMFWMAVQRRRQARLPY
ncbi:MAG: hypothetical protein RLO80_03145 [Hyphomonas sp.]